MHTVRFRKNFWYAPTRIMYCKGRVFQLNDEVFEAAHGYIFPPEKNHAEEDRKDEASGSDLPIA